MQTQSEYGYNSKVEGDVVLTTVDAALAWFRKNSVWPMPMGLACCAIELMAAGASRFDISRFGSEVMRFSPRQADCMIVAGTVTYKSAGFLKRIYDQMAEPKWVIAMGVCASSGGMFNNYAVVQGVDHIVPVDMYLPGCPPRPEMLIDAILKLHAKIMDEPLGPIRAGEKLGERTDLVASSVRYGRNGVVHGRLSPSDAELAASAQAVESPEWNAVRP
jgi:NADH-quinone oxidoreductase subunit B